jgi:hypothetical protein
MKTDKAHALTWMKLFIAAVELFLAMLVWMLAIMFIIVGREFLSGEANLMVSFTCCVVSVCSSYTIVPQKDSMPFLKSFMHCVCTALVPIFVVLFLFDRE